jgi:hypothetical protein
MQRADLVNDPPTLELPCHTWLLIDGPIDSIWVESINSVLDESRTLCLANNERVKLSPHMRLVFEVGDLSSASPAAVSRLGVVYVAADDLGWQPFVQVRRNALGDLCYGAVIANCFMLLFAVMDGASGRRRIHHGEGARAAINALRDAR